jgi:hypothetical protein
MDPSNYIQELRSMQITRNGIFKGEEMDQERLWTLLMVAGGHFAGMVVRITGSNEHLNKGKAKHKRPEFEILLHKTFHRYTSKISHNLDPNVPLT